jgi:hypothetical protein
MIFMGPASSSQAMLGFAVAWSREILEHGDMVILDEA